MQHTFNTLSLRYKYFSATNRTAYICTRQLNVHREDKRTANKKKKIYIYIFPCRNWAQQFRILRFEFVAKQIFNRIDNADRATAKNPYVRTCMCNRNILVEKKGGYRPFGSKLFARITGREHVENCPVRRNSRSNTFELTRSSRIDF